ncbi:MAG: tRNA (guanosine(46)-N7)-methyltransferase TrmB [FCB group bacterium]
MRHHTASNLYMPISELKYAPEFYPPVLESLEWEKIFLNGNKPDSLDIGCGKGTFLLNYGEQNQDKNILGLEIRKQPQIWLDNYIKGEQITNCAVIWYSVVNGLPFIDSESIEKIFFLFPDPWHKRKHNKRRAFNQETLKEFFRILIRGGQLYLATDVYEINEYHKKIISKITELEFNFLENDSDWDLPITNKENFCLINKIPVFRIICTKI